MRWLIMFVCFMVLAGCTVDQEGVSFKQQVIETHTPKTQPFMFGIQGYPYFEYLTEIKT